MTDIHQALAALNTENSFSTFDLNFSDQEKNALHKITLKQTDAYNNYGNLETLEDGVQQFLMRVSNSDEVHANIIANLISRLTSDVTVSMNMETAWVTVRASLPTNIWDTPRWHADGYYYSPYTGPQYKVVITLKGAPTLFFQLPSNLREEFNALRFLPDSRELTNNLLDKDNAIPISPTKGAVYIVGTDDAAVHSEPPTHEDRIFMSIVPGSADQIFELYSNWHGQNTLES